MKLTRFLYKAARTSNDIGTVTSGDPKRIGNRIKNKLIGRILGRMGVWNKLWKRP